MAKFKPSNTGKSFEILSKEDAVTGFESASAARRISASLALTSDNKLGGIQYEFVGIKDIPARYKTQDQGKFFPLDKVITGSIVRDVNNG